MISGTWRLLAFFRSRKCGLPCMTSEGWYFRFSPQSEHTT
jgi:hypothetical protein